MMMPCWQNIPASWIRFCRSSVRRTQPGRSELQTFLMNHVLAKRISHAIRKLHKHAKANKNLTGKAASGSMPLDVLDKQINWCIAQFHRTDDTHRPPRFRKADLLLQQ